MEEKTFRIRAYGFAELAQLYCPHSSSKSANETLHRWIKLNKQLQSELNKLGFHQGLRILSPKMVEKITTEIGEP